MTKFEVLPNPWKVKTYFFFCKNEIIFLKHKLKKNKIFTQFMYNKSLLLVIYPAPIMHKNGGEKM